MPNNNRGSSELAEFLEGLGLGQYAGSMADNDIDLEVLPFLSDDDLKELGLSLGHRRKLMAAVRADKEEPEDRPALAPALTTDGEEKLERRQISVLFCDLVASTELSQKLDPEDLRDVLQRYNDVVADAVIHYEGHVAKFLGDGVLAYFGWPNAHEAQAEMAIRAALAATKSVAALEAAGQPLAARVGIATGPVVIGTMMGKTTSEQGGVVGQTPNLAARLQDLAEPGEVVISESTRLLTRNAFDLAEVGLKSVKGFEEPVRVWKVQSSRRTYSRFEMQHGEVLIPFVGRTQEIDLLIDRWEHASRGEGQVVLLSGEAGIGKSRILFECTKRVKDAGCQILRYQCSPHEVNAALQPLISEVESAAGFETEDTAETRLDKLEAHLAQVRDSDKPETRALFAALLSLPGDRYPALTMTPQRRKQRILEILTDRIVQLSKAGPLLLLVEDIHWVDPSTLEVLEALVERAQDLTLLIVMTHRPEFQAPWAGYGHVTLHSLNRLSRSDGRSIAERIAGNKALPKELLDHIIKQTDGIPLFVEELTKSILEEEILEEHEDHYELKGPLPDHDIPTTLQDSLMARLDRLAPVKRVIQAASCIGREFDLSLLASALSMEPAELELALEQLISAQLIFRRGGRGEPRYTFKHALVQDAAYSSLLLSARRKLHERLAQALEAREDPDLLDLGRHFLNAGNYEKAATLYFEAGRRSLQASALPEAIGALELSMEALAQLPESPERDRRELGIRVSLGASRMANFGWAHPSVADAFEPAFPIAKQFRDEEALGSILWGLWVHYQTRTEFARAHQWLEELKSVSQDPSLEDLRVVHDMSAGCQLFWEADYEGAIRHTDALRNIYVPQRHQRFVALTNHDPLVFAQHWAGSLADWIRGYPDRSLERMEEALHLARKIGHPFNLVFALTAGATSLIYLDLPDRLLELCNEAATIAAEEALGPFSENVNVLQWRGGAEIQKGNFESGYAYAKKGNDFWNASGGRVCNAMFRSWIVAGLHGLGREEEALKLNALTIEHCQRTGDRYMHAETLRLRGAMLLPAGAGHADDAENLFRQALEIAEGQGAKSWQLRAAMSLSEQMRSGGREAEARALLEPLLESFTEGEGSADLQRGAALLDSLS
ncbi:MAG: adenylate/guanylate cyclase domain-containing protein [Limibacillus sp.]